MSLAEQIHALRHSAALTDGSHVACVKVSGPAAHEAIDRVSPRDLFLRSGQMMHTLFLDDSGRPIADVTLACDEEEILVMAEGPASSALQEYIAAYASGLDVQFDDLNQTHSFLCLNGPYAWELLAEVMTPDVIGLPYLGFFRNEDLLCFRSGKTGEYGFDLLIERTKLEDFRQRLIAVGASFDLRVASVEALEHASLENWFWNVRRESPHGITPIELQLQWRLSYARNFPGVEAVRARRHSFTQRAVLVAAGSELAAGDSIRYQGTAIGEVVHARHSYSRGDFLAMALVEKRYAYAGLTGFVASGKQGGVPLRTLSAPAVNNRSLYVDPQRHAYASRQADSFPPIVRV